MPDPGSGNQGIIANTVNSEATAVGANARAKKIVHEAGHKAAGDEVAALRQAIDALKLAPQQREVLEEDVAGLHEATGSKPDTAAARTHLKSLCGKLKMAGVVLGDMAALAEPARHVAEAIQKLSGFLGIG